MRPWPSAGTTRSRPLPRPRKRRAASMVTWRSAPTTTSTGGAPSRPSLSTSQPAAASTWWRAAARPVKLAICPPVTNPVLTRRRQPEQVGQPAGGDLLDRGRGRAEHEQAGVLVPGRGQPVGGQGGGQAAADHEPEVARPGRGDQPVVGQLGQLGDDLGGVAGAVGQRPAQPGQQLARARPCRHRPLRQAPHIPGRPGECRLKGSLGGCPLRGWPLGHGDALLAARRTVSPSQAQLKRRSCASPRPSPRSGNWTLPCPGTVGLSRTSEVRTRPSGPMPVIRHRAAPLAVALVDQPQLDLDGAAVGAQGLADHLGPERPDTAEHEPGPHGEHDQRGHDPDEHGGVPLDGAGGGQPGRVVAQRVGRALQRLLAALTNLAAGRHRRLAAGADAHIHSGRR